MSWSQKWVDLDLSTLILSGEWGQTKRIYGLVCHFRPIQLA